VEFAVDGISLVRPNNTRPKGRTIKTSEQRVVKLGAKGEKKKTRKCQKCGIVDGHNSRTCLSVEENRVKLASLTDRKRGWLPRSRNKNSTMVPSGMRHPHQRSINWLILETMDPMMII
jgi:hypothetical protein